MTSTPTAAGLIVAVDFTKGSAATVHAATTGTVGRCIYAYCTGRHMSYSVGTDQPVTCRSCIKKAANNGVDLAELAADEDAADEPQTIAEFAFAVEVAAGQAAGRLFA